MLVIKKLTVAIEVNVWLPTLFKLLMYKQLTVAIDFNGISPPPQYEGQ